MRLVARLITMRRPGARWRRERALCRLQDAIAKAAKEPSHPAISEWSRDGLRVELMIYAGSNLDKARRVFERTVRHRPRIRLRIGQRMRVLDEWPRHETML